MHHGRVLEPPVAGRARARSMCLHKLRRHHLARDEVRCALAETFNWSDIGSGVGYIRVG
jgi:hypothetical protein